MCLSTPITRGKGPGISSDPPPAYNSNNSSYIVNKTTNSNRGKSTADHHIQTRLGENENPNCLPNWYPRC